jgi:hypothetical protein
MPKRLERAVQTVAASRRELQDELALILKRLASAGQPASALTAK